MNDEHKLFHIYQTRMSFQLNTFMIYSHVTSLNYKQKIIMIKKDSQFTEIHLMALDVFREWNGTLQTHPITQHRDNHGVEPQSQYWKVAEPSVNTH